MVKVKEAPTELQPGLEAELPQVTEKEILATLRRHGKLKSRKDTWLDLWQLVGEFIHQRKQQFTEEHEPGRFLNREQFDSKGPKAAKTSASSLVSMLWPESNKKLRLAPPDELEDTEEHKDYYEFVTRTIMRVMDNPRAGLSNALSEYMLDQVSFGCSGIGGETSEDTKVMYRAWGVKQMSIAQGPGNFVDTVYLEIKMPIHQIVKTYGLENVSPKMRDAFKDEKLDDEEIILIAIEPQITSPFGKKSNKDLPWKSIHLDIKAKHGLKHSGFSEVPIKVGRFWKIQDEWYGRSPGMDSLPDILELNTLWEAVTMAIELQLQPPLGVLDDGTFGGGFIDTSAGGITVFNISGRANEANPIFPLFTIGEFTQSIALIESLTESIAEHFFIDRLLDFNNETRMTLGEAQIRNRLRNASLGSIFSRQIAELFSPLVEQTFNLLFEQGELGVVRGSVEESMAHFEGRKPRIIPDAIVEMMKTGEDVYHIEYFTPAMRVMQAEEAAGITQTFDQALAIFPAVPSVFDNIDVDKGIKRFNAIVGGPSEMMFAEAEVEEIRKIRADQQEQAQQQEQMKAGAEAMRNVGQSGLTGVVGAEAEEEA